MVTVDEWYLSFLAEIQEELDLDLEAWWEERQHLTAVERLTAFLEKES